MANINDMKIKAITLGFVNYREHDRILTLFSLEHGLLTATAHAVRRPKSEIRACADMFFFGEFVLRKNAKGYLSVKSADLIDVFYDLRLDMNKLSCATYMCDFVRSVALHDHEQNEVFLLLLKLLSQLCHKKVDFKTVKLKFEVSVMELLGFGIILDKCSICGESAKEFSKLSHSTGGIVCKSCSEDGHGMSISMQSVATLKQIQNMPIENISVIKISDSVYKDINNSMKQYISWHIERTFKSAKFLENNYLYSV